MTFQNDLAALWAKPKYNFRALARLSILLTLSSYVFVNNAFAQSRDDSGAGVKVEQSLRLSVGQKVPADFWTREHLLYDQGDTVRRDLSAYKGKLLVLDFWFIGCSSCLLHQKEIEKAKERYGDGMAVVMVNNLPKWNKVDDFNQFYTSGRYRDYGMSKFSSIIYDDYLYDLFASVAYPLYVWISPEGMIRAITNINLFDRLYMDPLINPQPRR